MYICICSIYARRRYFLSFYSIFCFKHSSNANVYAIHCMRKIFGFTFNNFSTRTRNCSSKPNVCIFFRSCQDECRQFNFSDEMSQEILPNLNHFGGFSGKIECWPHFGLCVCAYPSVTLRDRNIDCGEYRMPGDGTQNIKIQFIDYYFRNILHNAAKSSALITHE